MYVNWHTAHGQQKRLMKANHCCLWPSLLYFCQYLSSWILTSCSLLTALSLEWLSLALSLTTLKFWHLECFSEPGYASTQLCSYISNYISYLFTSGPLSPPSPASKAHVDTSWMPWFIDTMGSIVLIEELHKHCKMWTTRQKKFVLNICCSSPL